jgi:hypothetical protein
MVGEKISQRQVKEVRNKKKRRRMSSNHLIFANYSSIFYLFIYSSFIVLMQP